MNPRWRRDLRGLAAIPSQEMKALRSFTVRPNLPESLEALQEIAHNLRWSWDRSSRELFAQVVPEVWNDGSQDPIDVLAAAPSERLEQLATDPAFLEHLRAVKASLDAYGSLPRWFQQERDQSLLNDDHVVAYFSPEFGIAEAVPQYSGGLGVLAGDHLKSSSDLGVPLVGIGLFYRHGYFRQSLSVDGWQQERFPNLDPYAMALELCEGVRIEVELAGEPLVAQVWKATVGRTRLYLLDADLPENPESLQMVTDRLYGGDVEHRLRQEILLGIGGVRALDALGIGVRVFHTNEGHAGFLGLERIRQHMQGDGLSFSEALDAVRAGTVFTTHTPVPAGIDQFPRELIERYFGNWAAACGISIDQLMDLGRRPQADADAPFNMAVMGMRLAERRNGVSALHGEVSREMFHDLWPGVPTSETPVGSITNGVHGATWVSPEMDNLLSTSVGEDWQWASPDAWQAVNAVDGAQLWQAHTAAKVRTVEHVRERLREHGLAQGRSPSELDWVDQALDPEVLTICFARRMATYKRAALLLSQPERLRALLGDEDRPVQFIFAGKAHPADDQGKELIRQVVTFSHDPDVRHRFVFVEDYDMALARSLVQGADVWLNTPVRPMEASGTSGMKSVMNGGIHCSVLDGWWAECFQPGGAEHGPNGWAISSAESVEDEARRAEVEANSLFELFETQVVPSYYRDAHEPGHRSWTSLMKESLRTLGPFVSAHRMVRDYVTDLYEPAARRSMDMARDDYRGARDLAAYRSRLVDHWHGVHIDALDVDESLGDLGSHRRVEATVALGSLRPDEVEVQLVYGHVGQSGELHSPVTVPMTDGHEVDEHHRRFSATMPLDLAGRMGLTARVVPRHDLVAEPVEFGLVAWAG